MKRKRIGVLLCEPEQTAHKELLHGIGEQAFLLDYDVVVFSNLFNHTDDSPRQHTDNHIFDILRFSQLSGLLVEADKLRNPALREQILHLLHEKCRIPVFILNGTLGSYPCVFHDATDAFASLTSHFLEEHHMTQLYCLTGPADSVFAQQRLNGFRKAMLRHGLNVPDSAVFYGDFWHESARALGEQILSGALPKPEAILCTNDEMGVALCETLLAGGISVPQEIAVAGFDASDTRRKIAPVLTSYAINHAAFGANAVCMLHKAITGATVEPVESYSEGLLSSESCGCTEDSQMIRHAARINMEQTEHERLFRSSNFFELLIRAKTVSECAWNIIGGTYLLRNVESLSVCLRENWQEDIQEKSRERFLLWHGKNGKVILPDGIPISAETMFPALDETREKPQMFHFTPLYCVEEFFGYLVLSYGTKATAYDDLFLSWSRQAGTAFSHLRMQNQIYGLMHEARLSAQRDALTGLYNRSAFLDFFKEKQAFAQQEGLQLFLLLAEVENISEINRFADQRAGDEILVHVSELLLRACTKSEKCARLAGGSFCAVGCCKEKQDASNLTNQFRLLAERVQSPDPLPCLPRIRIAHQCVSPAAVLSVDELLPQLQAQMEAERRKEQEQNGLHHFEEMQALRQQIHQNLAKDWNVDMAAKSLFLSRGYFQTLYKQYFGICFSQDIINCRLVMAKQLLTETELPVSEVMLRCGFETYAHFLRLFKKNYGCTIQEYRQRLGKAEA